jgi:hypothetical protein
MKFTNTDTFPEARRGGLLDMRNDKIPVLGIHEGEIKGREEPMIRGPLKLCDGRNLCGYQQQCCKFKRLKYQAQFPIDDGLS